MSSQPFDSFLPFAQLIGLSALVSGGVSAIINYWINIHDFRKKAKIESLSYLREKGIQISAAKFYRIKKDIEDTKFERLSHIANREFVSQHLERIDQLELVIKEMWRNYDAESNPSKKVVILQAIVQVQPLLSQYYEASKEVMEGQVHNRAESNEA